jgi:hypothetical protein
VIVAGTGYSCRQDFPGFQGEILQDLIAFVIDKSDFIFAKDAELSAGEIEFFREFAGDPSVGRGILVIH